jgi:hypothetical protein
MFHPDLEGKPIRRLVPSPNNFEWHTWWNFSTAFFAEFLAVMGFSTTTMTMHAQYHKGAALTLFTIVATQQQPHCGRLFAVDDRGLT